MVLQEYENKGDRASPKTLGVRGWTVYGNQEICAVESQTARGECGAKLMRHDRTKKIRKQLYKVMDLAQLARFARKQEEGKEPLACETIEHQRGERA